MNDSRPELADATEAVKAAYATLNRNDIPAMVEAFDRDGKAIHVRIFVDRGKALDWAGVEAPDAG